jgi:hypothetical protein
MRLLAHLLAVNSPTLALSRPTRGPSLVGASSVTGITASLLLADKPPIYERR